MYTNFDVHLGYGNKIKFKPDFIAISDANIDGNFVLHHFISKFLTNDGHVCLLGFIQTLTHYTNACHKLGVNLQVAGENNQFTFVDVLKHFYEGFLPDTNTKDSDEKTSMFSDTTCPDFSLKSLLDMIKDDILPHKPCLVIVDDINSLVNIGVPVQAITDFIHYCKVLTSQNDITFVTLCHNDEDDWEYSILFTTLLHYATLEIHVKALKTGYSKDLSGEMNIVQHSKTHSEITTTRLHFKLLDKGVKFYAPGTSSAVL